MDHSLFLSKDQINNFEEITISTNVIKKEN
jgi:hypothetical protein